MLNINEDFLAEIIFFSLRKKDNFDLIFDNLEENYIPNDFYKQIWVEIINFKHNFEKVPSLAQISQSFVSSRNKDFAKISGIINRISEIEEVDEENIINTFEVFIKRNKFIEMYNKTAELFNKNEQDKAYDFFINQTKDFENFSLKEKELPTVFNDFNKRSIEREIYFNNSKQIQIPTGIDMIDNDTHGGFWTAETELWLGDSGAGKTKLLVSRGIASARRGISVLHVQAEGTEEQCFTNYDACWTGARYIDIKMNNLDDLKINSYSKLSKQLINQKKSDIHVLVGKRYGEISIPEIKRRLRKLKNKGIVIKHVIIDYMDLIVLSDGKKYDYDGGERIKQLQIARELKNIAMEFDCLVTTATQSHTINPQLLNSPDFVITRFNLGTATRKVEPFSYFLTINRTKDEADAEICRVHADKYRELKSGQTHYIAQNLGASRFYDKVKTASMFLSDD
jgi:replicative DNA helicase